MQTVHTWFRGNFHGKKGGKKNSEMFTELTRSLSIKYTVGKEQLKYLVFPQLMKDQQSLSDFELAWKLQKDEELRSGRTLDTGAAPPSPRACAPDFIYDVNEFKFSAIIPEDSQVELRSLEAYAQLSLMLRQEEEKHLLEIKGAEEQMTKLPLLSQQVEAKAPLLEWARFEDESKLQLDDSKLALLLQQEEERRIQKLHQEKIIEEEADAKMALLLQQEESSRILTFVCDICMDSHSVDGSYELECEHRFCQSCLLGYFQSKTFDNQTENIKCPNCHVCISQEIVLGTMRDCKRQDMEEQFVERASWNLITKCSTFIHCPNESCNNYTEWDPRMQGLAYSCQLCINMITAYDVK